MKAPEETNAEHQELLNALRTLAREDQKLSTPSRVEARILRAFDENPEHRYRRVLVRRLIEAAAIIALATVTAYWWNRGDVKPPASDGQIADAALVTSRPSSDALVWLDPEPESLQIVHVRVATTALAAQGYAVGDADGDGLVELEVILGADGIPRGVRIPRAAALAY